MEPQRLCALLAAILLVGSLAGATEGRGQIRERLRQRLDRKNQDGATTAQDGASRAQKFKIAGLNVAVWKPADANGPAPLVVFSHGYHGMNTQSVFIMQALAKDGYLVVAPNHRDAIGGSKFLLTPGISFGRASAWTDKTYSDRRDDVVNLLAALKVDPSWSSQIDWSKVALAGHSLGGYTALGLGGAWKSWKIPDVKAILALSPYAQPYAIHGNLESMNVPVMIQTGTRDLGIMPFVTKPNGVFDHCGAPSYLVVFDKAGHFSWSNLNRQKKQQELINHYCLAFLDKFVKGNADAKPDSQLENVASLKVK